jgi:hypothetical protein
MAKMPLSLNAIILNISNVMANTTAAPGISVRHVSVYKDATSLSKCIFIVTDIRTAGVVFP